MNHVLLKAATTAATDEGTFQAVISTASIDREKDVVEPAAMVASLQKWAALGKLVPLAWNHSEEVIGHIDPGSARIQGNEVVAKGWIDQTIDRGQEAWRLVKSGTLSFSFGYLFDPKTGGEKLAGGRYRIKELDVFEISVVPIAPANNDTRVLSWKAMGDPSLRILNSMIGQAQEFIAAENDPEDVEAMQDILDRLQDLQDDEANEPADQADDSKALRARADAVAFDHATDGTLAKRKASTKQEDEPAVLLVAATGAKTVRTEADFAALSHGEKLAIYYAALDAGALPIREQATA